MHRWLSAQGALAILFMIATGCASAKGVGGHDSGGGGPDDMGVEPVDLIGYDLLGVDLLGFGGGGDMTVTNCDIVAQTGCGSGEKCQPGPPDMANLCVSDGTKAIGQLCGPGSDDCVHGSVCIQENKAGTVDQCRGACNSDTDCKQGAAGGVASNTPHCIVTLSSGSLTLCTVPCQPVTKVGATGCATGLGCESFAYAPNPADMAALAQASDCTSMGTGGDGTSCTTNGNADCMTGFTCVNNGTAQKCRQVCRAGTSGDCTVGGGYICATPSNIANAPWGFCCPGTGC